MKVIVLHISFLLRQNNKFQLGDDIVCDFIYLIRVVKLISNISGKIKDVIMFNKCCDALSNKLI